MIAKIKMGTFDLSPVALEAVDKGEMLFAIDSQQYLMGYLPVVFFTMKAMYGTLPTANVMTGPAFIMKGQGGNVLGAQQAGHPLALGAAGAGHPRPAPRPSRSG